MQSGVAGQLTEARELWATGDTEAALAVVRAACEAWPKRPSPRILLAKFHARRGAIEDALDAWLHVREHHPDYHEGHVGVADCLARLGRVDEALALVDATVARFEGRWGVLAQLADICGRCGDRHSQRDLALRVLASEPGQMRARKLATAALYALGEHSRGLALAEEGLRLAPDDATLRRQRDAGLVAQGRFEEALAAMADAPQAVAGTAGRRLRLAAHYMQRMRALPRPIELVSLGQQCLAWTVPNRWGLRVDPHLPERRMPFNQAVHGGDTTSSLLEDDFHDYVGGVALKLSRGRSGRPYLTNLRRRVVFNHEDGRGWTEDDGRRLREEYELRVGNLRRAARRPGALFIYHVLGNFDAQRLLSAIRGMAGHEEFGLLILDNRRDAPSIEISVRGSEMAWVASAPFPSMGYTWHTDYNSEAGLAFERGIADTIATCARELSFGLAARAS